MFAWSKRSSHTVVSSCEFVLMEKSTVFLCGRSFFFFVFLCLAGIWPDGADGTDINAACRSHDGSLLASADDFGKVHLFSFPCSQPRVSHVNSQWQTQSTSEPGSACLYACVEICSTSQTRWLSTLPELRSYGVCLSTALWLSFNEHWGNPMKAQQK